MKKFALCIMFAALTLCFTACGTCKHGFTETIRTEATCTAEGTIIYTCNLCSEEKTESIPMVEHTYDKSKVITEATCMAEGVKTFTCTGCKETYTEKIAKIGHNYDGGKCTNCGGIIPFYSTEKFLAELRGLKIYYTGIEHISGSGYDYFYIYLRVVSTNDDYVMLQMHEEKVNGHSGYVSESHTFKPNKTEEIKAYVDGKFETYGGDIIDELSFEFWTSYPEQGGYTIEKSDRIVLHPYE